MYERFTDRARKVMMLAREEAESDNREYIGTEYVLLGLVKEGSGVAASVLKNFEIDLRKIRLEIDKLGPRVPDVVPSRRQQRWPAKILNVSHPKPPETPRVKKLIEYARANAFQLPQFSSFSR